MLQVFALDRKKSLSLKPWHGPASGRLYHSGTRYLETNDQYKLHLTISGHLGRRSNRTRATVLVLSTFVALSLGLAIERSAQQGDLTSIDHKPTADEIGSILDSLGQNNPEDADAADQAVDAAQVNGVFHKRATPEEIGAALDALGANNPEDAEAANQAVNEAEIDKRQADDGPDVNDDDESDVEEED